MPFITKTAENNLYENPTPVVRSHQACFPGLTVLPNDELLALFVIGEAFEAANCRTYVARSGDQGRTWQLQGELYDQSGMGLDYQFSDCYKPTVLPDGSLAAVGYGFRRDNPDEGISNPETLEILPGYNTVTFSKDQGKTWSLPERIDLGSDTVLEISGPCVVLPSGTLLAAGPPFTMKPTGQHGLIVASEDGGRTWSVRSRFFDPPEGNITSWETRLCVNPNGTVAALWWAFDTAASRHLPNRIAFSHDEGRTWSEPVDTKVTAQASNLMHLEDHRYLTIHCHRADNNPGLFVRLVDLAGDGWKVLDEMCIWGGADSQDKSKNMAQQFASLKFGQPSLTRIGRDEILAVHWCVENCQYVIKTHRLKL